LGAIWPWVNHCAAGMGTAARLMIAIAGIAPLAVLMGIPMPAGLARLNGGAAALLPWAWGINGFASVIAAPLAIAMGMTWGMRTAGAAALGLYLVAAVLFDRLPRTTHPP